MTLKEECMSEKLAGYTVKITLNPNADADGDGYLCTIDTNDKSPLTARRRLLEQRMLMNEITAKLTEMGMVITYEPEFYMEGASFLFRPKGAPQKIEFDNKFFANFAGMLRTIRPERFRGEVDREETFITNKVALQVAGETGVDMDKIKEIIDRADELRIRAYKELKRNEPKR